MQKLKFQKKDKILIVAAHPDDEILGCGGSILRFKDTYEIRTVFMTDGTSARGKDKKASKIRREACIKVFNFMKLSKPIFFNFPDNKMDGVPLLKIVKKLEKLIKVEKPKTIVTHFSNCLNIDHRKTYEAVMTACRPLKGNSVQKILSFEIISSTEWANFKSNNFEPNYYIDISKTINEKLKAMKFYKKELRKYPHSRSLKGIEALARYRGICCGKKFAEAFYLNRLIK